MPIHGRPERTNNEVSGTVERPNRSDCEDGEGLVLEQPGLKKEEPTFADPCIYLAGAAFPMEQLVRRPIAPQCVDVNDSECAIALLGYCDAQRLALVVNEIVRVKKRLP